jgi:hypothetical protein
VVTGIPKADAANFGEKSAMGAGTSNADPIKIMRILMRIRHVLSVQNNVTDNA